MALRPFPLSLALGLLSLGVQAQIGAAHASYEVTFDATWSSTTHPGAYPFAAHFSPLIGATHAPGTHLWEPGGIATLGIERMAELGNTGALSSEISALMTAGQAGVEILGATILSPGSIALTFDVTEAFPAVSLVSMIAPSPDWFVGVDDVLLLENGEWVEEKVLELFAWDAGTDSGLHFNSANADTDPQDPIAQIIGGKFQGPGSGEPPLGTFTFRRRAADLEFGTCANPAGSLSISGSPRIGTSFSLLVDDPGLSMPSPSAAYIGFSFTADANYPCGTTRNNWGLAAPGAAGELLFTNMFAVQVAPMWMGSPVARTYAIPNDPGLIGQEFLAQGALIDLGTRVGLTSGLRMVVGP